MKNLMKRSCAFVAATLCALSMAAFAPVAASATENSSGAEPAVRSAESTPELTGVGAGLAEEGTSEAVSADRNKPVSDSADADSTSDSDAAVDGRAESANADRTVHSDGTDEAGDGDGSDADAEGDTDSADNKNADANADGTISPEEASASMSEFSANTSYTVKVELRDKRGSRSMAGAVLLPDAQLIIDGQGQGHIQLHFQRTPVMHADAHATDFKIFPTGQGGDEKLDLLVDSEFTLGENLDGLATIILPKKSDTGYYWGWVNSNVMDHTVFLYVDWASLKTTGTVTDALGEILKQAPSDADSYTVNTWKKFDAARKVARDLVDANSADVQALADAYDELVHAQKALVYNDESPFKAAGVWYADVSNTDIVGKSAINKQAMFVVEENGDVHVTIKFNTYHDWAGSYIVREAQILDRAGNPVPGQNVKVNSDNSATWTFDLPYNSASGVYKALVTADSADPKKLHTIQFDWDTIRNTADFRDLNKAIEKAEKAPYDDPDLYTAATYGKLKKALEEGKKIAAISMSSQTAIDKALETLNSALESLRTRGNEGSGNTLNKGFEGWNAPQSTDENALQWEGSRVLLGHDENGKALRWRVLDKKQGLLILDGYQTGQAFFERTEDDEDYETIHYWDTSTIRTYLNGEWLNDTFDEAERALLAEREVKTLDYSGKNELAPSTKDRVWILEQSDYENPDFGFGSNATRAVHLYSLLTRTVAREGWSVSMRTVMPDGSFDLWFGTVAPGSDAVAFQPVIAVDPALVDFTLADDAEKFASVKETATNDWRLIAADMKEDSAMSKPVVLKSSRQANTITVQVESVEKDQTLMAAVTRAGDMDSGTIRSFGAVAGAGDSRASIELPKDFDPSKDTVWLMNTRRAGEVLVLGERVELKLPVEQANSGGDDGDDGQGQEKPGDPAKPDSDAKQADSTVNGSSANGSSSDQADNQTSNQADGNAQSSGKAANAAGLPKTGYEASGLLAASVACLIGGAVLISAQRRRVAYVS